MTTDIRDGRVPFAENATVNARRAPGERFGDGGRRDVTAHEVEA